jgi:hypothetical protein
MVGILILDVIFFAISLLTPSRTIEKTPACSIALASFNS